MSEEEKRTKTPPRPPSGRSGKKGGDRGLSKSERAKTNRAILENVSKGMKHSLVDTYDAEAILDRFAGYIEECKADGIIPTMEGVYLWLGMNKMYFCQILNRYEHYTRPEAVVNAFQKIKAAMAAIVSSAADVGSIAPATAIMKLTNSFGYVDVKQVQHVDSTTPIIGAEEDISRLEAAYKPNQLIVDVDLEINKIAENQAENENAESN